ncbi:hypothetical protein CSOJ01_03079 [Colletotrichum sojae]|uniref:Uncharacterized protein n=1 Tax=Colletotrichum sojae TaxID=2175907 RepID=A0A8H6N1R6_9PEZI|nr:hypothetical protein CSOJ01_03079 [Colletotrichum sojae]
MVEDDGRGWMAKSVDLSQPAEGGWEEGRPSLHRRTLPAGNGKQNIGGVRRSGHSGQGKAASPGVQLLLTVFFDYFSPTAPQGRALGTVSPWPVAAASRKPAKIRKRPPDESSPTMTISAFASPLCDLSSSHLLLSSSTLFSKLTNPFYPQQTSSIDIPRPRQLENFSGEGTEQPSHPSTALTIQQATAEQLN